MLQETSTLLPSSRLFKTGLNSFKQKRQLNDKICLNIQLEHLNGQTKDINLQEHKANCHSLFETTENT